MNKKQQYLKYVHFLFTLLTISVHFYTQNITNTKDEIEWKINVEGYYPYLLLHLKGGGGYLAPESSLYSAFMIYSYYLTPE